MAEASAAKQKKWYDPTYSHGMTPEERGKFRERMWQDFGPFGPPPEPKP